MIWHRRLDNNSPQSIPLCDRAAESVSAADRPRSYRRFKGKQAKRWQSVEQTSLFLPVIANRAARPFRQSLVGSPRGDGPASRPDNWTTPLARYLTSKPNTPANHCSRGTIAPDGKPRSVSFGRLETSHPPPSALTSRTSGLHATTQDIDVVTLVRERGGLPGDDLQIGILAPDVTVGEGRNAFPPRIHRFALLLRLMREECAAPRDYPRPAGTR